MKPWWIYSWLVFAILFVQDILHRFLMKQGYNALDLVVYGLFPTFVTIVLYMWAQQKKLTPLNRMSTGLYILSGVLSFYGFLYLRKAQILSPNMGYVNAIVYSSMVATIGVTAWLFKDSLHWQGWLGAVLVVIGIGLMSSI